MKKEISCVSCLHYRGIKDGVHVCDAFKEGIPYEILNLGRDHRIPYKGDNGIVFEYNPNWDNLRG